MPSGLTMTQMDGTQSLLLTPVFTTGTFVCQHLRHFSSSWKNSRKLSVTTSCSLPNTVKGRKYRIKLGELTNQEQKGYTAPTSEPPGAAIPKAKWYLAFCQLLSLSLAPSPSPKLPTLTSHFFFLDRLYFPSPYSTHLVHSGTLLSTHC